MHTRHERRSSNWRGGLGLCAAIALLGGCAAQRERELSGMEQPPRPPDAARPMARDWAEAVPMRTTPDKDSLSAADATATIKVELDPNGAAEGDYYFIAYHLSDPANPDDLVSTSEALVKGRTLHKLTAAEAQKSPPAFEFPVKMNAGLKRDLELQVVVTAVASKTVGTVTKGGVYGAHAMIKLKK